MNRLKKYFDLGDYKYRLLSKLARPINEKANESAFFFRRDELAYSLRQLHLDWPLEARGIAMVMLCWEGFYSEETVLQAREVVSRAPLNIWPEDPKASLELVLSGWRSTDVFQLTFCEEAREDVFRLLHAVKQQLVNPINPRLQILKNLVLSMNDEWEERYRTVEPRTFFVQPVPHKFRIDLFSDLFGSCLEGAAIIDQNDYGRAFV